MNSIKSTKQFNKIKPVKFSLLGSKLNSFSHLQPNSNAHNTLTKLRLLNSNSIHSIKRLASQFIKLINHSLDSQNIQKQNQFAILISDLINSTKSLPPFQSQQEIDRILLSNFIPWAAYQSRPRTSQELTSQSDTSLHAAFSSLSSLTDIRRPQDLYPEARRYKREIHLHVGPTNSGKTHTGLRALHSAHTGVYAGPLRLLAHEVFSRMNSGQIANDLEPRACNLLTGEEQRIVHPTAGLTSCTVEMLSSNQFYDVVVIDEIQMIGDLYRGDAWTQALLGVQAKQVHLCGEESVINLIENLTKSNGDNFILHRYERLTPLKVSKKSLNNDLKKIRPGDCVVSFSRTNLYNLKKKIQTCTNLRVGMAYGGLPPEVREREAQLFNLGSQFIGQDGYDVLVGSDAIGMGLNLKIKRVIFESLHKFDGRNELPLSVSQIKQIGGRAGRYGTKVRRESTGTRELEGDQIENIEEEEMIGEVLTLKESDMTFLREAMASPFEPIQKAVLKAPFSTVEGIARRAPLTRMKYSNLLELRRNLTLTSPEFKIGDEKNSSQVADALESIKNLSRAERDLFSSAPANPRSTIVLKALQNWANVHSNRSEVDLNDWIRKENIYRTIEYIESFNKQEKTEMKLKSFSKEQAELNESLLRLESIHKSLVLYLWLSFRLPESFVHSSLCLQLKIKVEEVLGIGLNSI